MDVTMICAGVGWVPAMVAVSLISASLMAYIWAALTGAVTVYAPYISEAGASPPQSGVFSLLLYFGSLLACATMLVRYVVIRNLNRCCRWSVDVLNVAALMAGLIAVFGNLIVSAYPSNRKAGATLSLSPGRLPLNAPGPDSSSPPPRRNTASRPLVGSPPPLSSISPRFPECSASGVL